MDESAHQHSLIRAFAAHKVGTQMMDLTKTGATSPLKITAHAHLMSDFAHML